MEQNNSSKDEDDAKDEEKVFEMESLERMNVRMSVMTRFLSLNNDSSRHLDDDSMRSLGASMRSTATTTNSPDRSGGNHSIRSNGSSSYSTKRKAKDNFDREVIALFGGTGRTGKYFMEFALKAGYKVQANVRSRSKLDPKFLKYEHLTIIEGDFNGPLLDGNDSMNCIKHDVVEYILNATCTGADYVVCMAAGPNDPKTYLPHFMSEFIHDLWPIMEDLKPKSFIYQACSLNPIPKSAAEIAFLTTEELQQQETTTATTTTIAVLESSNPTEEEEKSQEHQQVDGSGEVKKEEVEVTAVTDDNADTSPRECGVTDTTPPDSTSCVTSASSSDDKEGEIDCNSKDDEGNTNITNTKENDGKTKNDGVTVAEGAVAVTAEAEGSSSIPWHRKLVKGSFFLSSRKLATDSKEEEGQQQGKGDPLSLTETIDKNNKTEQQQHSKEQQQEQSQQQPLTKPEEKIPWHVKIMKDTMIRLGGMQPILDDNDRIIQYMYDNPLSDTAVIVTRPSRLVDSKHQSDGPINPLMQILEGMTASTTNDDENEKQVDDVNHRRTSIQSINSDDEKNQIRKNNVENFMTSPLTHRDLAYYTLHHIMTNHSLVNQYPIIQLAPPLPPPSK